MNEESLHPKNHVLATSIFISSLVVAGTWLYTTPRSNPPQSVAVAPDATLRQKSALEESVLPSDGVVLPVRWGDLGIKMASVGVIDAKQFEALYADRAGAAEEMKQLLYGENNGNLKITEENSGMILNLLWALGLGTKNAILEHGPMMDARYGGAGTFASTAGWTIAEGDPMDHYSRHPFAILTPEQQKIVERVSKNIYRPCCGNATYFPDCNHGMAMLGLLELMASQNVSEAEMYRVALQVNAYWFPDNYLTIATHMKNKGVDWKDVSPREMLGINYSSASGYAKIASQVSAPQQQRRGGGCGVDAGAPVAPQRQQSGCGI